MDADTRGKLMSILYTLNRVSVAGKDNMDRLLGCIQMLERLAGEEKNGERDSLE